MRDWGGGGSINITAQNPSIGAASSNASSAIFRSAAIRRASGLAKIQLITAFSLGNWAGTGFGWLALASAGETGVIGSSDDDF